MNKPWRKCSTCKRDIFTSQKYFVCAVSTCSRPATNYVFCSDSCWDAHNPVERHREDSAGMIEKIAPKDMSVVSESKVSTESKASDDEILVVVSKVRKYIADRSGMNTSASAYEELTRRIKRLCDAAIDTAQGQGRKTVMDRDIPR